MTDQTPSSARLRIERQALDLVERCLDRPIADQEEWLKQRTEEDPRLRDRANALLAAARNESVEPNDSDLRGPALMRALNPKEISDAPTRPVDPSDRSASLSMLHRGEHVGSYRIDEELGRGGMGVVYRAHRSDGSFDLSAAIKVMQPLPGRTKERFETERKILARLDHPNIARILDGGHTIDDAPYLVMELVEGTSIAKYCDDHRLTLEDRIELFLRVVDAVQHAHQRLVVHRDLKPGNILVTDDGQPKLLDFGIAKLIDPDVDGEPLTQAGMGVMTPEYASPEQVRHEPITVATDIYSLGVILFELLTGRRPYTIEDRSLSNIERVVCDTRPPSPSNVVRTLDEESETTVADLRRTDGERLEKKLHGDLDAIVMTALEKRPEDRYSTVGELAEDLRNYLSGKPVQAQAQTWTYLASRFFLRHKGRVALVAAIFVLTAGGLAVGVVQSLRAGAEGRRALEQAQKLEQTNLFLDSLFTSPDPMWGMGRDTTVVEVLDRAIERIDSGESLDDGPAVLRTIGQTYRNLGDLEKALEVLERAVDVSIARYGEGSADTAIGRQRLAIVVSDLGESERAVQLIEQALNTLEPLQSTELPTVWSQYAAALVDTGQIEKAEDYFEKATAANRQAAEPTLDHVINLNNYGVLMMDSGRRDEAIASYEEALRIYRELDTEPTPLYASLLANLASEATINQDYERAEKLYLESIAITDQLVGEDHPQSMTSRASLVDFYNRTERFDEAEEIAVDLLARATRQLPEGHPIVAYAQVVYATTMIESGRGAEVQAELEQAIATRKASLPENHWLIASAQSLLGASLLAQGKNREAEELLESSYQRLLESVGADHDKTNQAAEFLAQARAAPDS